eukprot:GFUD01135157.1.p1 GENE.GFUD01135157.1~~GFUD01135157.1.p1  ORF type:complete len:328 (+),score=83.51 GFUD01135157.1:46-1029(+)
MPSYSSKDIKRLAKGCGYHELEVSPRDQGRMVSYRHNQKCGGVRINVYTTTGTVATCLDHPRVGKGQLFRRNMTYADLQDIFSNPRVHKDVGYHRLADGTKQDCHRMQRLSCYEYNFDDEDIVDQFVSDEFPISENFDSISLGYDCFFILQSDGSFMFSSGIPKGLHNKLWGRQTWLPKPELVKIGKRSCQSYFVQFADGSMEWNDVPDELDDLLDEHDKLVDILALGEDDEYYVKFDDGSEHWSLPVALSKLLNGRKGTRRGNQGIAGVSNISLGFDGNYAVKFTDGRIKSWGDMPGYSKKFDKVLGKVGVKYVELGARNDFVIIG